MARDLVTVMLDVPPDSFELTVDITMPPAAAGHLRRAKELHAEEKRVRRDAAAETRAAASIPRAEGLSLRDIGALLGVSFQRAHQLTTNQR